MKSRVCFPLFSVLLQHGCGFHPVIPAGKRIDYTGSKGRERRQRHVLLGTSMLLILCWTIGAIWLISVRRNERSSAEIGARQERIAALFPGEMAGSR